jgi:hypothetical protein
VRAEFGEAEGFVQRHERRAAEDVLGVDVVGVGVDPDDIDEGVAG